MRTPILLAGAALALSFGYAPPAAADDEVIIVTATRAPAPAQTLPTRVDVIDRADIEALNLVTLTGAIGPEAVQSGGAGQQTSLFLRGANSNHALALFDGVPLNDAASPNGAYDFGEDTLGGLERVEVLRGPASSVYGPDAIGGVVNMIPRRGGAGAFAPFFETAFGSLSTQRMLVGAAGSNGGFSYGLSAESFETHGFDQTPARFAAHTGDPDGASVQTGLVSMRQQFGALGVDALARVRRSRADYDTFSGGPFFDLRADDPGLSNQATQALWRIGGDAQLGTALVRLSGGQVRSDRSETDAGVETGAAAARQSFADLSARFEHGGASLTAGLSYARDDIHTRPQFADPLAAAEDRAAAYVVAQIPIADHVIATGSLRADHFESLGAHATYQLGAVAEFAPLRVFASYGTAFKAPSLSERYEVSFFNVGNPGLRPEDSRSWEAGADWRASDIVTFGASYYQTRIGDLIEYDFSQLKNVNVGRAAIDGAEAYVLLTPAANASLRIGYAWTDARNAESGQQLARRPRDAWRLEARWRFTGRLSAALQWTYVGARQDVIYDDSGAFTSASGRTPASNVGSVSATFDLDAHAQLFARIDNVSDEIYEQPSAFAGPPRTGTIGVRARF